MAWRFQEGPGYVRVKNKIIVLHSFKKKSWKTDQRDLDLAEQRLKKFLSENK
jgi:phage-related protein